MNIAEKCGLTPYILHMQIEVEVKEATLMELEFFTRKRRKVRKTAGELGY
jgi:hypothetical protein